MGWTYAFHNLGELKGYAGYTLLAFRQIKFQHYNFIKREKWMKGYALEKWELTLNFVFMPMDTM